MAISRAWIGSRAALAQLAVAPVRVFLSTTLLAMSLAGCGAVAIHPEPKLPKPLLQQLPASVGLIVPADTRKYRHKETRWGVDWDVDLGAGHMRIMHDVFVNEFEHVEEFKDLESARAAANLQALFEARIDQYSFVTARETGGRYYAVTIRYRINLYTPQGEKSDSFTLTGYGNSLAKGMKSSTPLLNATNAAMRDAAAKFLVQFPDLPAGQKLAHHESVTAEVIVAAADSPLIDAVPIDDPPPEISLGPALGAAPAMPAGAPPPTPAAVQPPKT